jgi:hypothetical protein
MEDVDEDFPTYPRNEIPLNMSRILELSDGSDDDDCPPLITVEDDGDSDDEDEEEEEVDEPEESAEAELGQ